MRATESVGEYKMKTEKIGHEIDMKSLSFLLKHILLRKHLVYYDFFFVTTSWRDCFYLAIYQ